METIYTVYRTDGSSEEINDDLPEWPGFDALRRLVSPLVGGGEVERVRIWHADLGITTDMFVPDDGALRNLPVNPAGTTHYQAATKRHAEENGYSIPAMPSIHGTAVVFHRPVWN